LTPFYLLVGFHEIGLMQPTWKMTLKQPGTFGGKAGWKDAIQEAILNQRMCIVRPMLWISHLGET
jgi:hypothetical protein